MTDALDLIAEARARQEKAESECRYWKEKAAIERRRCKRVIDAAKLRPVPPPDVDAEGHANWDQIVDLVNEVTDVLADPYARHSDDDDEYNQMTHDRAKDMMAFRLHIMIEEAVKKGRQQ